MEALGGVGDGVCGVACVGGFGEGVYATNAVIAVVKSCIGEYHCSKRAMRKYSADFAIAVHRGDILQEMLDDRGVSQMEPARHLPQMQRVISMRFAGIAAEPRRKWRSCLARNLGHPLVFGDESSENSKLSWLMRQRRGGCGPGESRRES